MSTALFVKPSLGAKLLRSLVRLLSRCLPARRRGRFDASVEERGARIRENIKRHLENTKYCASQNSSFYPAYPTKIGPLATVVKRLPARHCFYALVLILLSSLVTSHWSPLQAQTGNATLSGVIQDPKGAIVPDTEVTITRIETGTVATTKSNGAGVYYFTALSPGHYHLMIQKPGFKQIAIKDIELHTQDKLEQNFSLEIGSVSESITVNAETTNESPAVSMTVTHEFVENVPLNGRSFQDLIQLAPGTVSNGEYYSVNGQRTDANNFTVDGVSANLGGINNSAGPGNGLSGNTPTQTALGTTQSLVSVDALQEFKIQTSGYTAEYGRSPGGQVQFTTRSGTNDIHGTLFEYFRNTVFDANSYVNDHYGYAKPAEHQNDYGGTVGGPLVIPRLYNGKDKTFFFISYERLRLLTPAFESEYVPTPAFRSWASPSIQPYLNSAPLPNPNSPGNQDGCTIPDPSTGLPTACDALFTYSYSSPSNIDNISVRLDQNFSGRFHAFVRYADTPSSATRGAEAVTTNAINTHTWTVGLVANITGTLLNDFRFNYSRDGEYQLYTQQPVGGSVPLPRDLLIPVAYDNSFASGSYSIYLPSAALYVGPVYAGGASVQHQFQVVDSLSWSRGSHGFKFGVDWRRLTPLFSENPYYSNILSTNLTDIQQGYATQLQIQASAPGQPVFDNFSLYAEDHWKVSPTLSLDYGLRWELNPPPGPSNGHYPAVLTSNNLATAQLAPLGTAPYKTSYDRFAPRFGFAWNAIPSAQHAVTVRGGFGIFYDTAQGVIAAAYENSYPFGASGPNQNHVPLPLSEAILAPPTLNVPLTPPYPYLSELSSPSLTLPYTEQWNLSVDEAINSRNTFTVSYVGNEGKKLLFTGYYQSAPGNPINPVFANGLEFTNNGSNSNYNALQVLDRGRIANGLDFVGSFTWAHALDNSSSNFGGFPAPLYGNSDNDLRRVLNLALNYQTSASGSSRWERALTSGWVIANRFSTQSGYPLNIYQDYNVPLPNGGAQNYLPDLVPGVPIYLHGSAADVNGQPVPGSWRLNSAAFALVPTDPTTGLPVRQGTLGRNYVRGPGFYVLNTAVQRSFPVYERLHLIFRVEAFNIFNHPNLDYPDTGLPDSTFGQLTGQVRLIGANNQLYGMGSPRSLQLSLKLQF
jgi:hypothetical protein